MVDVKHPQVQTIQGAGSHLTIFLQLSYARLTTIRRRRATGDSL
jgi:hypothetical protein